MSHYTFFITVLHLILLVAAAFPVCWWIWTEIPAGRRWLRGRLSHD
jgi:hypothetical protein